MRACNRSDWKGLLSLPFLGAKDGDGVMNFSHSGARLRRWQLELGIFFRLGKSGSN
jgi:hypothetical protein